MKNLFRAFLLCAVASSTFAATITYTVSLSGLNEVPPNAAGFTGAGGGAFDTVSNQFNWAISSTLPFGTVTGAHFHNAPAGVKESQTVGIVRVGSEIPVAPGSVRGVALDAWFPAEVFTGFDPATNSRIGFHYVVHDTELGDQTLAVGSEFPYESDPSLWQTVELCG